MNTFTIADAYNHGWKKTKEQFWLILTVLAIYLLITMILSRISDMSKDYFFLNLIVFVVTLAIGVALRIGLTRFFLNADENKGAVRDLFTTDGVFFTYFVGYIILSVLTIIGLVLLIVPGVIVALMYFFVPTLIVDRKMEVLESFKESAAMTKGHRLHLLGFLCIALLVNFVGLLALAVGLFVTIPMTFFAGLYIYRRLLNAEIPVIVEPVTEDSSPSVSI